MCFHKTPNVPVSWLESLMVHSSWSCSSSPIVVAAYNHERTQEVVNGDEVHREA